MARSIDSVAAQYSQESQTENFQVEPKTLVMDIPEVEREAFLPVNRVPAIHLCPPGYAWQDFVASMLFRGIAIEVMHQERTWPDKTHLASKDVPEFWELVEAAAAQETA